MHYVSGTTQDFHDIVDAIINLMQSSQGGNWSKILERNSRDAGTTYGLSVEEPDMDSVCKERVFHNTGYGGTEDFYIGIREWDRDDYSTPLSGFDIAIMNDYVLSPVQIWNFMYGRLTGAINTYNVTYNRFTSNPGFCTTQGVDMDYWISSTKQRIFGVVKILSNYESFYFGAGDRFGNPSDYPTPMIAMSTSSGLTPPDQGLSGRALFVPAGGIAYQCISHNNEIRANVGISCLPYDAMYNHINYELQSLSNGRRLCMPVYVVDTSASPDVLLMQLEGVYHIFGQLVSSEDKMTIDGDPYLVFQNLHKVDYFDFMAFPTLTQTTTTSTTTTSTTTTSTSTTT